MKLEEENVGYNLEEDRAEAGMLPKAANVKAVIGSMVVGKPESLPVYKQELEQYGSSSTLDSELGFDFDDNYKDALENLILQSTPEEAYEYIEAYKDMSEQGVDVRQLFVKKYATTDLKDRGIYDPNDFVTNQQMRRILNSEIQKKEEVENIVEGVEALGEALVPAAPFALSAFYTAKTGREFSYNNLLAGEDIVHFREYIDEPSNPQEKAQRVKEVAEVFYTYGSLNDNSWLISGYAGGVLGDDFSETERWVMNAFSLFPAVGYATVKIGKKIFGNGVQDDSALGLASGVNTDLAESLHRATLGSDEVAGTLAGTNRAESFIDGSLPNFGVDEDLVKGAPDSVLKSYERQKAESQAIYEESSGINGLMLSPEELEEVLEKERELVKESYSIAAGIRMNAGESSVQPTDSGFRFEGIYTAENGKGFATVEEGVDSVLESLASKGVDLSDLKVRTRVPNTNEYRIMSAEEVQEIFDKGVIGDFKISVTRDFKYKGLGTDKITSKDYRISGWEPVDKISQNARWAFDYANKLPKQIVSLANRMVDKASGVEGALLKSFSNDLKRVGNLANRRKKQKQIFELIEEGNNTGKNGKQFTYQEMVQRGFDDDQITAVFSFYNLNDTFWRIDNRYKARKMSDDGYYVYNNADANKLVLYKPIEDAKKGNYLDPVTGEVKVLNEAAIKQLKDEGYSFGKLNKTATIDGKVVSNMMFKRDVKTTARNLREDDIVLGYRAGYFQKKYKGDYFIIKKTKAVDDDGNLVDAPTVTVANAANKAKATYYAREMQDKADDGSIFEVVDSVELSRKLAGKDLTYDDVLGGGRTVERHRGASLNDVEDLTRNKAAEIENPLEAITRSAANTANAAVYQEGIAYMKRKWIQSYGKYTNGKFPTKPDDLKNIGREGGSRELREAKELSEYINLLETNYNANWITDNWFKGFHRIAELLDGLGTFGDIAGKGARTLRDLDPLVAMRTLPFVMFIALSPIRQLLLQTAQLSQVLPLTARYGIQPYLLGADMTRIQLARMVADTKYESKVFEAIAKTSGRDVEDWKRLVKAYEKSGLPQTVDKNQLVEGFTRSLGEDFTSNKAAAVLNKTKNIAGMPIRGFKRIGFDAGESNNLLGTWLVAVERHAKMSKKSVKDLTDNDMEIIADSARRLSWNMNKASKFKYQYGALSVPTQFLQVAHKAILYMAFGNRVLTPAERARVFATNLGLFGTAGLGISGVTDMIRDGSKEADEIADALEGAFVDATLNTFGDWLLNEDPNNRTSDVDISANLSPMSGLLSTTSNLISGLVQAEFDFFGTSPFGGSVGVINRTFQDIKTIVEAPDTSNMNAAEKSALILKSISSAASGYNYYMLSNLAEETGKMYSSTGNELYAVTRFEILAKMAGFGTVAEKQYYEAMQSEAKKRKMIKDLAKEHYVSIKRVYGMYQGKDPEMFDARQIIQTKLLGMPEQDRQMFLEEINKLVRRDFSQGGIEDSLLGSILKHTQKTSRTVDELVKMTDSMLDGEQKETARELVQNYKELQGG
jgi:hypothetical protein